MKKLVLSVATALLFAFGGNAQIQVGATTGLMRFSAAGTSSAINYLGVSVQGKYEISDVLRVGANIGYYGKSESGASSSVMPITGLAEYTHKMDKLTPFGGVELGLYRNAVSFSGMTVSTTNLGFAPVVGAEYEINEQLNILGNVKYNYILTSGASTSALGLNIGVVYKL